MEFAAQKKILESPEELDKLVSAASASDDSEKKKFTDFVTALDKLLTSEEEHQLRESMLVPGISSASPVSKPTIPEPPKEDAASKPLGEPDSLPKTVRTKARIDALLGVTDGDTAKKAKELTAAFNGLKLSEDAREALTGILPGRKVDFTDPRAVTKEVDQILETMGLPEYKSDKNPPDPQGEIVRNFTTLRLAMNTLGSPISKGGE
jgi:hypothetical protein